MPKLSCRPGGTPIIVESRLEGGFCLTPNLLERAITPRTKWLIFNQPGNPSGACYTPSQLHAIAAVLVRHPHVCVLTDDMFEHLVFDGMRFHTLTEVEPALYPDTLTLNGVSKAHAMTGWRIGPCGGPLPLIQAMAKLQSRMRALSRNGLPSKRLTAGWTISRAFRKLSRSAVILSCQC